MFLSSIALERISEADLRRLISGGVREGRDLDFNGDAIGDDRPALAIPFKGGLNGDLLVLVANNMRPDDAESHYRAFRPPTGAVG